MHSPHHARLHPHPSGPSPALRELHVDIDWRGPLLLRYELRGNMDALRIPPRAAPQHTDELWRHTCCELFLAIPGTAGYLEFNFSPGGPWAAYQFDGYRSGMRAVAIAPPAIAARGSAEQLEVQVDLALDAVPLFAGVQELRCALSAVIEEHSGARSFWALVHPAAQADFHHADGFALHLSRRAPAG